MTKFMGILLSLVFATVSCSSPQANRWEARQPAQDATAAPSLSEYELPTDETTKKALRELRAGLAFSGNSADTQTNLDKVKSDIEKRLKMILTVTSGSYIILKKLDMEIDAAVAANKEFSLETSPTYIKTMEARQNIDLVEGRMLATYVQLWKYALSLKQKQYPVPASRTKVVSERAREILAFTHDLVRKHLAGPRSIGLINLRERCDDILDSIAVDMASQTEGSRGALVPLSTEFGRFIAEFEKAEQKIRDSKKINYTSSLNEFINEVGALDDQTQQLIDRKPQSNIVVEGFQNKSGNDFGLNKWVLTFDDGPHKTRTQNIAKVLADQGIKGEFFWLSNLVKTNKTIAKEIYDAGHNVSSHSMDHADLTKQSATKVKEEVSGSRDTIEKTLQDAGATNYKMKYFRCPYGACWAPKSKTVQQAIKDANLVHVFWTVDSVDWQDKNTESVKERVLKQMKSSKRGIILFHDIHPVAENVLPLLFKDKYVKDNNVQWLQL